MLSVLGFPPLPTHPELSPPSNPLNPSPPDRALPPHWPWNLTSTDLSNIKSEYPQSAKNNFSNGNCGGLVIRAGNNRSRDFKLMRPILHTYSYTTLMTQCSRNINQCRGVGRPPMARRPVAFGQGHQDAFLLVPLLSWLEAPRTQSLRPLPAPTILGVVKQSQWTAEN